MPDHIRNSALALLVTSAQPLSPSAPPPGLAKCGPRQLPGPVGSPKSKALRAASDATARAIIEVAFQRTGPTAERRQQELPLTDEEPAAAAAPTTDEGTAP